MSEKPISPLRQRMLEDMNMRRFVPDTDRPCRESRQGFLLLRSQLIVQTQPDHHAANIAKTCEGIEPCDCARLKLR